MFFSELNKFDNKIAIIDGEEKLSYSDLVSRLEKDDFSKSLPFKLLVFIKASSDIDTIIAYLSNLAAGNIVHLYDSEDNEIIDSLIGIYNPNLLFKNGKYNILHDKELALHPDTALLLSTSGSTGTPKFVRLSAVNIQSNATSIAKYLKLQSSDKALLQLKLHYSFGISILNSYLLVGGTIVLTDVTVMDDEFGDLINKHKITSFSGVPFTFQSLDKVSFNLADYPTLRQITQAGGKMQKEDVLRWHRIAKNCGIDFFVMYGQTEASPRISYLPPRVLENNPESIGIAVPDGEIYIVDEHKDVINIPGKEGELVYRGPNVMQGYATELKDLNKESELKELYTGDIAKFNDAGLFTIVGRNSRFVKLFGVRTNLDDLEKSFKKYVKEIVCTGDDSKIIVAHLKGDDVSEAVHEISKKVNIPEVCFQTLPLVTIPTLSNGKVNYKAINQLSTKKKHRYHTLIRFLFSKAFLKEFLIELFTTLGFIERTLTVKNLFAREFPENTSESFSFKDLGGDSMTYVTISMELDEIIGFLPESWESLSIKDLMRFESKGAEL